MQESEFGYVRQVPVQSRQINIGSEEKILNPVNGCLFLLINFILMFGGIALIVIFCTTGRGDLAPFSAIGAVMIVMSFIFFTGFFTNDPNTAIIVLFYGTYRGTIKDNGFFWINPLTNFIRLSLKSRNLDGGVIKVNDKDGSPIEIAIVVVWKVANTAQATFDVENYELYLKVQSESAIRHIASSYPYDKHDENEPSLRGLNPIIIQNLVNELQLKTKQAGIIIEDAKITHLAYSPEISNAMLKRQQAQAIIEARQKIIQGAIGIVRESVTSLDNMNLKMNDQQKANLVTNLLVVLCSENQVNPVVNAGSSL